MSIFCKNNFRLAVFDYFKFVFKILFFNLEFLGYVSILAENVFKDLPQCYEKFKKIKKLVVLKVGVNFRQNGQNFVPESEFLILKVALYTQTHTLKNKSFYQPPKIHPNELPSTRYFFYSLVFIIFFK